MVANGLGATIVRQGMLGVSCEKLADGARILAEEAEKLGMPIADYVLTADTPGAVFIVVKAPSSAHRSALQYFKMGAGPYYIFTRPFHVGYFEAMKTLANVLERHGTHTFNNGAKPVVQVVAIPKRDVALGERVGRAVGSFEFRGEAVRITECPEGVPVALLAGAKFVEPVKAGAIVTFRDVELPESRALEIWKDLLYNNAYRK